MKKVASPETCPTYPTNHQVHEKPKNVTFAPRALMHCFPVDGSQEEKSIFLDALDEEKDLTTGATIVQAPYVLAIKDGYNTSNNLCASKTSVRSRSPSPVLPAVRTRNLINALPKTDNAEVRKFFILFHDKACIYVVNFVKLCFFRFLLVYPCRRKLELSL